MTKYQYFLAQPDTTRIKALYPISVDFVHVVGDVGKFSMTLPLVTGQEAIIAPDRRIEILRRPIGGTVRREFYGFIQSWEKSIDSNGKPTLTISGTDAMGILDRRMVIDSFGDSYLSLSAKEVDDAMKDAVRDNLTASKPSRTLAIISCDPDITAGPQITRDYSNISLIGLLQDLQAYSRSQGSECFFGLRQNATNWDFFTQVDKYGSDRTDLVFSDRWRNVENVRVAENYSKTKSVVYALGAGVDDNRAIREVEDTDRTNLSIYGRRETTTYATNSDDNTALDDAANDALAYTRPVKRLLCSILDTQSTRYGVLNGWNLGDKITTEFFGAKNTAIVRSVQVRIDAAGRETIRGNIEVVT